MAKRQVYSLSSANFRMPNYTGHDGVLRSRPAELVPIVQWPDGRWCHDVNTYVRELFERNLSRRNRGGTIAVVVAHLAHLVRYCWSKQVRFIDLTDGMFAEFVAGLRSEERPDRPGSVARNANTVLAIGRDCLGFLQSVGRKYADEGFVGESGRIVVRVRHYSRFPGVPHGRLPKSRYLHHSSFPRPSPKRTRVPVETAAISSMRNVVHVVSKNKQQRARRRAMLLLLEITGARRGEVASISVAAIRQAAQMKRPMLEVATLKRRQETPPVRYIPVSNADMVAMLEYVEVYRNAVVRKKWRGADHGLVLVSSRSGAPLCDSTITAEVKLLAKAAGIKQNVCPHMFRHRYITKLFVEMISRHQIENADEFRRALLSTESLKQRMLEWTGHTSILSLNTYISLAFDELSSYRKTLSHVQAGTAVESFLRVLKDEIQALRIGGGGKRVEPERLLRLAEALQYDLEAAFDEPD